MRNNWNANVQHGKVLGGLRSLSFSGSLLGFGHK